MFKTDQINSIFNCTVCSKVLHEPISLPCGETICRGHSDEVCSNKCSFCDKDHALPEDGFPTNKLIQKQLTLQLNTIDINFSQFNDSRKLIEDLNKDLREIESCIGNDPATFIYDYFGELSRQVDLRRETLIKGIHEHSDTLIQKIARLKEECMANEGMEECKLKSKIPIDVCKAKLEELNAMFSTFKMDDRKVEEILTQKISKGLQEMMEPIRKDYESELLGGKSYKLAISPTKIGDVLGLLKESVPIQLFESTILSDTKKRSLLSLIGFESKSLTLLWRASRDGFSADAFHSRCDSIPNTLTVVECTNGNVIGGFTSVAWASEGFYHTDPSAFIYTLVNPENLPSVGRVSDRHYAVYHNADHGPTFGGGFDLHVSDSSDINDESCSRCYSYEFLQNNGYYKDDLFKGFFQTVDVEVYQVV